MAQQCADDARARAPPRKRVCMHVLTLSLSLSPLPSRAYLPPTSLFPSSIHVRGTHAASRSRIPTGSWSFRAAALIGRVHPPSSPSWPPLESCARVYTRRGEGRSRRHTRVTFKLGLRDTISASWNTRSRGLGGRCRGFVAARRPESSKFD